MSRFAADTTVSVSASKAEIERIVERYGAGHVQPMLPDYSGG